MQIKRNSGVGLKYAGWVMIASLTWANAAWAFRPVSVNHDNVALSGYDTVAYFVEGRAVKGSPAFNSEWNGAVWWFSTQTNLRLFEEKPQKYVPAFGGYCAFAMSDGEAVVCDPEAYMIKDGKLYVMKNKDLLRIWQKDPDGYLAKAKKNWKRMTPKREKSQKE